MTTRQEKVIAARAVEELVLRATMEVLASDNRKFSTTDDNFRSILDIITKYKTLLFTDEVVYNITNKHIASILSDLSKETIYSLATGPGAIGATPTETTKFWKNIIGILKHQEIVDSEATQFFTEAGIDRKPGSINYNQNGSVGVWTDQFGNTGITDGSTYYSDSFINFYGTVENGTASASLGAHLRALADLIGLDRKIGLDGTYAREKEGSKVAPGNTKPGDSGTHLTGPSVTDGHGNAVLDGNGKPVLGLGDDSHGENNGDAADFSGGIGGASTGRDAAEGLPIILDLDGDGIQITELSKSTVFVDATGDGLLNNTAWAGAGNGVLFYDPDDTGEITEKRQYVFTEWDPTATSDIEALRSVFDSNGDGVFDASDDEWSNFKVMVTNADGSLEAKSLSAAGVNITSIDLTADATNIELPDGSKITGTTTFTRSDGSTGTVGTPTPLPDSGLQCKPREGRGDLEPPSGQC